MVPPPFTVLPHGAADAVDAARAVRRGAHRREDADVDGLDTFAVTVPAGLRARQGPGDAGHHRGRAPGLPRRRADVPAGRRRVGRPVARRTAPQGAARARAVQAAHDLLGRSATHLRGAAPEFGPEGARRVPPPVRGGLQ